MPESDLKRNGNTTWWYKASQRVLVKIQSDKNAALRRLHLGNETQDKLLDSDLVTKPGICYLRARGYWNCRSLSSSVLARVGFWWPQASTKWFPAPGPSCVSVLGRLLGIEGFLLCLAIDLHVICQNKTPASDPVWTDQWAEKFWSPYLQTSKAHLQKPSFPRNPGS